MQLIDYCKNLQFDIFDRLDYNDNPNGLWL